MASKKKANEKKASLMSPKSARSKPSKPAAQKRLAPKKTALPSMKKTAPLRKTAPTVSLEAGGSIPDGARVICSGCSKAVWDVEQDWGDPYHPFHPCEHTALFWTTNSDSPTYCEDGLLETARKSVSDDDGGDGDDDDDDDFDADADDEFESDDDEDDSGWVFAHGDEIAALAPNHFSKTVVLYEIVGHDTAFVVVVGAALRAED